jgi:tRNA(fMet)-specific endonuclease VapC
VGLILDTNFVITAEREGRRGQPGATAAFLAARAEETFVITFTVAGELACGRSASAVRNWERLCRPFRVLPWTMDVAWQYGEIYRQLQSAGTLIGANDMWIAATALVHGMGVVTRNLDEFQRVAGLTVVSF